MSGQQRVAVVGATGYAGFELAQLLLRHPGIAKPAFYLRESAKTPVNCLTDIFPQLRGWGEAPCRPFSVEGVVASGARVTFLATPHEASLELVPRLMEAGQRVVDLSGAFRFRDGETFARWYQLPVPAPETVAKAVYGLPELYGKALPGARLVANPGCYAT
jgi:N-acetyl-gamma-glutamyl-phosphate reductase